MLHVNHLLSLGHWLTIFKKAKQPQTVAMEAHERVNVSFAQKLRKQFICCINSCSVSAA